MCSAFSILLQLNFCFVQLIIVFWAKDNFSVICFRGLCQGKGGYLEVEGIVKTWRIKQEVIAAKVDIILPGSDLTSWLLWPILLIYFLDKLV